MNVGHPIISFVWNILTKPNYIGAALVIAFIQYRSTILNFVQRANNDGILRTFLNLILNLADVVRGYYHMFREIIRSLGQNFRFSFAGESDGTNSYSRYSLIHGESSHLTNNDRSNVQARSRKYDNRSCLPPLVVIRNSDISTENETLISENDTLSGITPSKLTSEVCEKGMIPLEPAFLNKEDYPEGWLVYHPILGISSLEEADQYDEQQQLNKQSPLEHRQCHQTPHLGKK